MSALNKVRINNQELNKDYYDLERILTKSVMIFSKGKNLRIMSVFSFSANCLIMSVNFI